MSIKHLKVSAKADGPDPGNVHASDWNAVHDLSALVAGDVSDFAEAVDDRVAALLVPGANITLTYDDPGNKLTVASTASGGAKTTIDDTAPTTPAYGDRWIKPSNMTEMVWVPNAGQPGIWINPADAAVALQVAYPIAINKGGTGATTAPAALLNLGVTNAAGQNILGDGTVAAPGLAFNSEPGLGWFRPNASAISMASGGVRFANFDYSSGSQSTVVFGSRQGVDSTLYLRNAPVGVPNHNQMVLVQAADGSSRIATTAAGTATRGNLTLDAPVVTTTGASRAGSGFGSKNGASGAQGVNVFNLFWTTAMNLFVDDTLLGAINVTPPSDIRLKKDVAPLRYGLSTVLQLDPIEFDYDHDQREHLPQGHQYGFSAQAVEEVVPNVVSYVGETRHLDQRILIPILVNAIKTLNDRITQLENP